MNMVSSLLSLDGNILLFIQEYIRNPVLDKIFISITKLGDKGLIWILLTILLLCFEKTRKVGVMVVFALVASYWINNQILKNIVARVRPYDAISRLVPIVQKPGGYSFPSGHTASSFAAAFIMYKRLPKKYGVPCLVLAVLIGLSRLYVGVHYPTDVVVGMFSGIVISWFSGMLVDKI